MASVESLRGATSAVKSTVGSKPRSRRFQFGGITDYYKYFEHLPDLQIRRGRVYSIIDEAKVQKWVVFIAGAGFFTDAYDIFAVNTALPMISFVYWGGWDEIESGASGGTFTALLCVTLAGSMIGSIAFGLLGDMFGRNKMYAFLLVIIMWATLGLAGAADGSHGSMSIVGWLFMWRFFMGVGIGGDCPLSAAIASEFAPTDHRSEMLAWLFSMQPLGQLAATLVGVIVTASFKAEMQDPGYCKDPSCFRSVDQAWRAIVGIGGVPALVAFIIRLRIPESPRYTLEVLQDGERAEQETGRYFGIKTNLSSQQQANTQSSIQRPSDLTNPNISASETQPAAPQNEPDISLVPPAGQQRPPLQPKHTLTNSSRFDSHTREENEDDSSWVIFCKWYTGLESYIRKDGNWIHLAGTLTTWFLLDVSFCGLGMSSPANIQRIFNDQTRATTAQDTTSSVYSILMGNAWHSLLVVSLPAVTGGLAMIFAIQRYKPVKLQSFFFVILALLFFIIGGIFDTCLEKQGAHWVLMALYMLCQFFFNLGPNATTYIIHAEQFDSKYRCTCHGLAAASGKFGSVIGQLIVGLSGATNPSSTTLRIIIAVFGVLMLLGAVVTQLAVPDSRYFEGNSISLENLAKGPKWMERLRKPASKTSNKLQWWNRWHDLQVDQKQAEADDIQIY